MSKTAYVMPDIQGYKSMATGEWISSRSEHREHLKRHNLVEIGNEKIENKPRGPDRAGIRRAAEEAVRRVLG
ncbi:zinc ribbon domain-containing protein [Hydrogenophaga sp.]|uniref:zinc ribbon domain-containing protein n=1 Tax=Hydrogenophaga sp. TaxID=1904254 RepID=UPI002715CDFE|nr:zinc ribbon domain-containing protein [Hydrogenophaga sp.]MDO9131977.1 zinc ribbon domain-containing protein [Hydrogenophaga sp.]